MIREPFYSKYHDVANAICELFDRHPERRDDLYFPIILNSKNNNNLLVMLDGPREKDILWGSSQSISYYFVWDGSMSLGYRGYRTDITREELIDYIKEKYPDHFEWLLFHPELM